MATQLINLVSGSAGQLTAATATYYTSTNAVTKILSASLVNTTAGPITATVWIVPSGGSAADQYKLISAQSILAGQSYSCPELVNKNIVSGGTLQATASSATSITFIVSGAVIS